MRTSRRLREGSRRVKGEGRASAVGRLGTASSWRLGVEPRRACKWAATRGDVEKLQGGTRARRGLGRGEGAARGRRPRRRAPKQGRERDMRE